MFRPSAPDPCGWARHAPRGRSPSSRASEAATRSATSTCLPSVWQSAALSRRGCDWHLEASEPPLPAVALPAGRWPWVPVSCASGSPHRWPGFAAAAAATRRPPRGGPAAGLRRNTSATQNPQFTRFNPTASCASSQLLRRASPPPCPRPEHLHRPLAAAPSAAVPTCGCASPAHHP